MRLYCWSSPKPFRRRLCPSGLPRGLVHRHRTWRLIAYSYGWGSRTTEDLVTVILVDTIYLLKKNWERIMDVKGYYYAGLRQVLVPGLSVAEAVERLHRLAYVERRMMRLLASRILSIPQRSLKVLLPPFPYTDTLPTHSLPSPITPMPPKK